MWYAKCGHDFNSIVIGLMLGNGELVSIGKDCVVLSCSCSLPNFPLLMKVMKSCGNYLKDVIIFNKDDKDRIYKYTKRFKYLYKRIYRVNCSVYHDNFSKRFDIHMIHRINYISLAILYYTCGEIITRDNSSELIIYLGNLFDKDIENIVYYIRKKYDIYFLYESDKKMLVTTDDNIEKFFTLTGKILKGLSS